MPEMGHHRHHRHHHHHHHRSRKHSKPVLVPAVTEQPPASVTPKILSNIHPIYLEESVQGGIGQYVSVSVLDPVMRVERSGGNCPSNPAKKPVYRIILSFRMQLSINRRANDSLQRHNHIFDSVSVRYLYRSGEKHDLLPKGDQILTDISISHETGRTSEVEAGIAGASGHIAPAFTVHAQHASKLTYERTMASWRKALTYEAYPPLLEVKPGGGIAGLFAPALQASNPEPQNFQVSSSHAENCTCRRFRRCRRRLSRHNPYDRAAHWTGQTEAQLHLWTPEIYENLNSPLTITREVNAEEIDDILGGKNLSSSYGRHILRKHLHFDFDVEVRLREIGWGFWNLFKSSSKPPEIRARNDHGRPLPTDKIRFCVTCCTERINWPQFETRDLQTEAEEQTAKHGYVRRLQSTEEYEDSYNNSRATVESSSSAAATAVNSTSQMTSPVRRRKITHSPMGLLRIFTGVHPLERYQDYRESASPRSSGDDIDREEDDRGGPCPPRGRRRDREECYERRNCPPLHIYRAAARPAQTDYVRVPIPPRAPTPPTPSCRPPRPETPPPRRRRTATPFPVPFSLPIRKREPPRRLLDYGSSSLEDYVLGRMSMTADIDTGGHHDDHRETSNDDDDDDDDDDDNQSDDTTDQKEIYGDDNRETSRIGNNTSTRESDYKFKLLPPVRKEEEDDDNNTSYEDDGRYHRPNLDLNMNYRGSKNPQHDDIKSRSSYRQPTVLTVSSDGEQGDDQQSDSGTNEFQEMREVKGDGSSWMRRDLLREISALHGIRNHGKKRYIWDEHTRDGTDAD